MENAGNEVNTEQPKPQSSKLKNGAILGGVAILGAIVGWGVTVAFKILPKALVGGRSF